MGEQHELMVPSDERVSLDTYAGKIHVEWNPQAAVTPLGQLPFFISFLKVSGLYDDFVYSCPLSYISPNAPAKPGYPRHPADVDPCRSSPLRPHHLVALRCG
jgi:hypothetical protein